jgi:RimJ/RimL family protein N-acetyltransferase
VTAGDANGDTRSPKILEFLPATRKVLRLLASEPADFAEQYGVQLHEVSQTVAQHSLAFMRTFPLETSPDWFGHFAIEGESQRMIGVCSLKGPPVAGTVEIAFFTFPGFEGRGVGTEMARFVVERARQLPDVRLVIAHTPAKESAATRVLEKIGMRFAGEEMDDSIPVWRWETQAQPSS